MLLNFLKGKTVIGKTRMSPLTKLMFDNAAAAEEGATWASKISDVDSIRDTVLFSGSSIGTDASLSGRIQASLISTAMEGKSGYQYSEALRSTAKAVMDKGVNQNYSDINTLQYLSTLKIHFTKYFTGVFRKNRRG